MLQGTDIIGKPLISHSDGVIQGGIKDVLFSAKGNLVLGFLIEESGVFSSAKAVPFSNVQSIGPDSVIIADESAIVLAEEDNSISDLLNDENVAIGTHIMTDGGEDMGKMNDIYFDEKSGIIEGYEVSGGIFADSYSGKTYLPAPSSFRIGEDVAFIPNETAEIMRNQTGGIKGSAQKAGQSVKETVSEKAGSLAESLSSRQQEMGGKAQAATKEAGNAVQEGASKVSSVLGAAWESLKSKATEVKDSSTEALEKKRIESVLGKPVNRIILDKQDNPILEAGDIVTNEAINKAREADALNMLLSSTDDSQSSPSGTGIKNVSIDIEK